MKLSVYKNYSTVPLPAAFTTVLYMSIVLYEKELTRIYNKRGL